MKEKPIMTPQEDSAGCSYGNVNREKALQLEKQMKEITDWMRRIENKVEEALKRPGWAVLVIISALSSLCVGLIVARMAG